MEGGDHTLGSASTLWHNACILPTVTAAVSLNSQTYLGHNQEVYQELRLALQLKLRRQLLVAVCDDVALQRQVAQRLETNFSPLPETVPVAPEVRVRQLTLVTLTLDGDRPDLVREVLLWLKQQRRQQGRLPTLPIFQIVGIDQLTRQSPTVQNRFLASLVRVDALLTQLDCRLVVWVSRPWLGKIRQSVPGFWRSRSGLFEFMGEPSLQPGSLVSTSAPLSPVKPSPAGNRPDLWRVLRDDLSTFEQPAAPAPATAPGGPGPNPPAPDISELAGPAPDAPAPNGPGPKERNGAAPLLALSTLLDQGYAAAASGQGYGGLDGGVFSSVVMPPVPATTAAALAALQPAEVTPLSPDPPSAPAESPSIPTPSPQPSPSPKSAAATAALQLPADLAQDAELVSLWRYTQSLVEQQAGPLTLARAYLTLGQLGRDRVTIGEPAPGGLEFVTAAYDQAVAGLPEGTPDWCDALNDLASLHWLQGQQAGTADPAPWLWRSVTTYEKALQGGQEAIPADTLGRIYGNLATVYGLLANLDRPTFCLEKAVEAYRHGLEHTPAERSPVDYANGQNSLGAIHWRLAQQGDEAVPGDKGPQHHLSQAIVAYTEALRYQTAQAAPLDYAMIQNNLGIAYWSLAQHQQPVFLLERAIAAYQTALTYRTVAAAPAGCAATANNLGTTYWDLAQQPAVQGDRRLVTLQQAAAAYETAMNAAEIVLTSSPAAVLGFDLWATCHSAGVVHDQLAQALPEAQAEARQDHLAAALRHYLRAYQGWRDRPQQLDLLITALVYNIHLNFEIFGIPGQQTALSQLPGDLLPQVLRRL